MTNQTSAQPMNQRSAPPQQSRPTPAQPQPRPAEATPPPQPPVLYHATFQLLTPAGFPVDLGREIPAAQLVAGIKHLDELLTEAGFKPRLPMAAAVVQPSGPAAAEAADEDWVPKFCPDCGSKRETFYDNREDANRPAGAPDLKCRQCKKGFWKEPPRRGRSR